MRRGRKSRYASAAVPLDILVTLVEIAAETIRMTSSWLAPADRRRRERFAVPRRKRWRKARDGQAGKRSIANIPGRATSHCAGDSRTAAARNRPDAEAAVLGNLPAPLHRLVGRYVNHRDFGAQLAQPDVFADDRRAGCDRAIPRSPSQLPRL